MQEAQRVYAASIATFATSSGAINLTKAYKYVYLEIPSMTSNAEHYLQGSSDGVTFRRIYLELSGLYAICSAITNAIVRAPGGFQYVKVETSAIVSFSPTYKIICVDD